MPMPLSEKYENFIGSCRQHGITIEFQRNDINMELMLNFMELLLAFCNRNL